MPWQSIPDNRSEAAAVLQNFSATGKVASDWRDDPNAVVGGTASD